jgi:hypothetical protein
MPLHRRELARLDLQKKGRELCHESFNGNGSRLILRSSRALYPALGPFRKLLEHVLVSVLVRVLEKLLAILGVRPN